MYLLLSLFQLLRSMYLNAYNQPEQEVPSGVQGKSSPKVRGGQDQYEAHQENP